MQIEDRGTTVDLADVKAGTCLMFNVGDRPHIGIAVDFIPEGGVRAAVSLSGVPSLVSPGAIKGGVYQFPDTTSLVLPVDPLLILPGLSDNRPGVITTLGASALMVVADTRGSGKNTLYLSLNDGKLDSGHRTAPVTSFLGWSIVHVRGETQTVILQFRLDAIALN